MKKLVLRVFCATALLVGLVGGPVAAHPMPRSHSSTLGSNTYTITISSYSFFVPKRVTPGAQIWVVNKDQDWHTVTADDRSFDLPVAPLAKTHFEAPSKPGTYPFYCGLHTYMKGRLVVRKPR